MLTTKRKLQIARTASAALRGVRRLAGLSDTVSATRGGIRWELDLAEGIDLGIYLGAYQSLSRRVRETALRPGMIAFDIGANIGAFTLPLATLLGEGGRVFAFEATDFAFSKLRRNVSLNPSLVPRIELRQAVLLASDSGEISKEIYASWRLDGAGQTQQHPEHGGFLVSTKSARSVSLDTLIETDPDLASASDRVGFVKLDVDGHELDVLRGGRRFFSAVKPNLLIEVAPYVQNETPGGLQRLLDELTFLGYGLETADQGVPVAAQAEAIASMIPEGSGVDMLCRPLSPAV